MIVTTNNYSCDMYISTLFSSSVILNRWCINSITGHIQIYVGIAAIISLFSDISLTFANRGGPTSIQGYSTEYPLFLAKTFCIYTVFHVYK